MYCFLKHAMFSRLIKSSKLLKCCNISNKPMSNPLKVCILTALSDNYMYLLIDQTTKIAAAIDPVEPDKILSLVKKEGLTLTSVLTTHHHLDHAGGNAIMTEKVKNLTIYGGDVRIDSMTEKLSHNDAFKIGSLSVKCLETPCHTSGHVSYFVQAENENVCFTGDTLFVGGCGRFFEGEPKQMLSSLNILSLLPGDTRIYCGHEYTVGNLKFAAVVEPNNSDVKSKLIWAMQRCESSEPTVPSTIGDELKHNPFLRVTKESVKRFTQKTDPVEVMGALRKAKDNFVAN